MRSKIYRQLFVVHFLIFTFHINCLHAITDLPKTSTTLSFKENKGQVSDQYYKARPDVLFSGTAGNLLFHLKNNGIAYQLNRVDSWTKQEGITPIRHGKENIAEPDQITIYRLDINWLNANTDASIKKGEVLEGYDNYYLETCPQGALHVKSYKNITYQQLYAGIDLKWYEKNGNLKYDYLVAAGADYKQIQLEFNGAEKLNISKKGELVIKTPLGEITEAAPYVTQNGKQLVAKWLINKNIVSFDIKNIDPSQSFVIDPLIRLWGTYYGGNNFDSGFSSYADAAGNVFMCGSTLSNNAQTIATIGSFQNTFGGIAGNNTGDAFLVKFSSSGVRLWGTYFGGAGDEYAMNCCVDINGDIYLTGATSSTNTSAISTPGCHQFSRGGGSPPFWDAYLAKFNSAGIRQWGTYYGGNDIDMGNGVTTDNAGNIYLSGYSNSTNPNVIATPGSHQTSNAGNGDGFLAKFDGTGTRLWSTYYGGEYPDNSTACVIDNSGNIYMVGVTNSTTSIAIATPGSHQPTYGGGALGGIIYYGDGYIVKFDPSGVRQWGTYYGGLGQECIYNCAMDAAGNIYFSGPTASNGGTSIATPGSHQFIYGGGNSDAMLVKFNQAGVRQWGTYYGGAGVEDYSYCFFDNINNCMYISGMTGSSSGTAIATPCTYQDIYGGGTTDAFLAKFTISSSRVWGTYFGGTGSDDFSTNAVDGGGNVYLVGETSSTGTVIASSGSHQSIFGGGQKDAFVIKFDGCKPFQNTSPPSNQTICLGNSAALTTTVAGCSLTWFNTIGGLPIGTGSVISVSPVSSTIFYIDELSCGSSNNLGSFSITVVPAVTVAVNANTLICSGNTLNLNATGTSNYTWMPGGLNTASITINPLISITQSVIGSNGYCNDTASIYINVIPNPNVTINVFPSPSCSGSAVTLTAIGAQNYTWSPANNLASTNGATAVSPPLFTNETFTLTGSNVSGTLSCSNQTLLTVNVIPSFTTQVSNSVTICEGDNTMLTAFGGNTYYWVPSINTNNPNQQTIIATPLISTIYSVAISVNNLCPVTQTVFVHVNPKPYVFAGNDTTVNAVEPIFISATGNGQLQWISGENIDCFNCAHTQVYPNASSCYVVEVVDVKGCKAHDEICLNILIDNSIYIPNTFTPNNDGLNDVFYVYGLGLEDYSMTIFNRWGAKIFTSTDQARGWDGKFNGKDCKEDTYIYKLTYKTFGSKLTTTTGHVNLIK